MGLSDAPASLEILITPIPPSSLSQLSFLPSFLPAHYVRSSRCGWPGWMFAGTTPPFPLLSLSLFPRITRRRKKRGRVEIGVDLRSFLLVKHRYFQAFRLLRLIEVEESVEKKKKIFLSEFSWPTRDTIYTRSVYIYINIVTCHRTTLIISLSVLRARRIG